jgi:hypothetical protein
MLTQNVKRKLQVAEVIVVAAQVVLNSRKRKNATTPRDTLFASLLGKRLSVLGVALLKNRQISMLYSAGAFLTDLNNRGSNLPHLRNNVWPA